MKKLNIPKEPLLISLIQTKSIPADFNNNVNRTFEHLKNALSNSPDIIILPELWSSGYDNNQNLKFYSEKNERLLEKISTFAKQNKINIFAGSFILNDKNKFYNRFVAYDINGEKIAQYDKMHLFETFGEKDMFKRGKKPLIINLKNGWVAGILICYDIRFPELARYYFRQGCNLLISPSQWPGIRNDHWRTLIRARAIENQSFFAGCNVSANIDKKYLFGGSIIVDPWGLVLAEAGQDDCILYAVLDPDRLSFTYSKLPIRKDLHTGLD